MIQRLEMCQAQNLRFGFLWPYKAQRGLKVLRVFRESKVKLDLKDPRASRERLDLREFREKLDLRASKASKVRQGLKVIQGLMELRRQQHR